MRRIITRLNSVHRICCEEFVLEEKKQWNSNESTESIPENLLCTISASKKTVLQRKQRAAYVTHAISVFYWRLTGWNLNVLILFSFIVLPAHPTLYRVSLRASQPFDGIDRVFFFSLSKLRLWQQAIGILYCLSSHGLKIAMQDDDDTGAATSSLSSKDAVSAGKISQPHMLFCGDSYACVCFELSISVCLTNLWDLNLWKAPRGIRHSAVLWATLKHTHWGSHFWTFLCLKYAEQSCRRFLWGLF